MVVRGRQPKFGGIRLNFAIDENGGGELKGFAVTFICAT